MASNYDVHSPPCTCSIQISRHGQFAIFLQCNQKFTGSDKFMAFKTNKKHVPITQRFWHITDSNLNRDFDHSI